MDSGCEIVSRVWDFDPIIDLLHALSASTPSLPSEDTNIYKHSTQPAAEVTKTRLGDLSRVFNHIGVTAPKFTSPDIEREADVSLYQSHLQVPSPTASKSLRKSVAPLFIKHEPHDSSSTEQSLTSNEAATPTSSVTSVDSFDPEHFENYIAKNTVRWKDDIEGKELAEYRQRSAEPTRLPSPLQLVPAQIILPATRTKKRRQRSRRSKYSDEDTASDFESEPEFYARPKPRVRHLWAPTVEPQINLDPTVIKPFYTLTPAEKRLKIAKKLSSKLRLPSSALTSPRILDPIPQPISNICNDGVHIFVDCSNIICGFYDALKSARNIPLGAYMKQPPMSFHSLALIMERNRAISRRVLVGSTAPPIHNELQKYPDHVLEAGRCGYEINMLERVWKRKVPTPKKKGASSGNGLATFTSGSASEGSGPGSCPKMHEQAVDEILHMKLLESLVDTEEPSTIVLASGDAAEAEYSGGFLKNVERALLKGWNVEIVSWKKGLGMAYRQLVKKWKGKFMIIELDEFSEELLALYPETVDPRVLQRVALYG